MTHGELSARRQRFFLGRPINFQVASCFFPWSHWLFISLIFWLLVGRVFTKVGAECCRSGGALPVVFCVSLLRLRQPANKRGKDEGRREACFSGNFYSRYRCEAKEAHHLLNGALLKWIQFCKCGSSSFPKGCKTDSFRLCQCSRVYPNRDNYFFCRESSRWDISQ